MYSPLLNKKRVTAANALFQQRFPHSELTYHSRENINEWNNRLEEIRGKNGTFTRTLHKEEEEWVTNERMLCKIDHRYVLSNYGFIKNRTNDIVPFEPNIAQGIALDVLSEMEEDGRELILQFLKARRLGVSTLFQLLIWARMMFTRNINAVIGASSPTDSEKLSSMFLLAAQYTPYWLRPLCTYFNDSVGRYKQSGQAGYWEFQFSTDERAAVNRMDLVHGGQEQDIGRSFNPSACHLTELAKFLNADRSIDGGLMRAMVPSPKNLACFEGTGEGDTGWWPDKYNWNKRNYGRPGSGSRMRPTFLPWYVGIDLYPTSTDLITQGWHDIKGTWEPNEKTKAQAEQAKRFVHSNDLLRKHLGPNWEMPREQMFFYETNIKEYKENKRLHVWLSEMAADDRSALTSNHKSVYDPELLMRYRDAVALPATIPATVPEESGGYAVFGLKCTQGGKEEVPKRFQPIGHNHKAPSMRIVGDWTKHYTPFEFEFYPLQFKGYSEFDESGKIIIWEFPKHGEMYALSTDNGDGVEEDRSVIQVLRKGSAGVCDAQVAEFASGEISGVELWPWVLALGTLYAVRRDGKIQLPLLIPETNREGGQRLLKDVELRGWPLRNIYSERTRNSTSRGSTSISYGWHMSPANRDDLILYGSSAIENEWIELNSPELINEMSSFIRDPRGKMGAAKGRHDDRVIALFLAFHALYHSELRATTKDPNIERGREMSEAALWPVMSDGAMSNVSTYMENMVGETNWPFE